MDPYSYYSLSGRGPKANQHQRSYTGNDSDAVFHQTAHLANAASATSNQYRPNGHQRNRTSVQPKGVGPNFQPAGSQANSQATAVPSQTLTTDKTTYMILETIQAPSNGGRRMSHGIRLLKHPNGTLRVEKRLLMEPRSKRERAEVEGNTLLRIADAGGSPHINHIYEAFWATDNPHSSLILEHCDKQSLQQFIDHQVRSRKLTDETFCWHVLRDLSAALSMCHYGVRDPLNKQFKIANWNMICHLDIKPGNVFLSSKRAPGHEHETWPRVVLGDFGCAVSCKDIVSGKVDREVPPFGTPGWFPPECRQEDKVSFKGQYGWRTDIWQLGGLIQTLCYCMAEPLMARVEQGEPVGASYSFQLNTMISRIMTREFNVRPTAVDVAEGVNHLMHKRGL